MYYIYFSSENLSCFVCGEEGHVAKFCKNTEVTQPKPTLGNATETKSAETPSNQETGLPVASGSVSTTVTPAAAQKTSRLPPPAPPSKKFNKRPASPSPYKAALSRRDSTEVKIPSSASFKNTVKPITKRAKKRDDEVTLEEIKNMFNPARHHIEDNIDDYPISYDQLVAFLQQSYGATGIDSILNALTDDTDGLVRMLTASKNLKTRITRLIRKLSHPNDQMSDSSFTSASEI
ncbi:unnamed protein product [Trichogramma brassicae]|uniref:CCHC-type domain-containing protein n=1 Tax=Trichogramma brassicae TaxID=86971 RepID=A0A6H5ICS7_9HYME|nr:unnamed protein product [Trichogramma brassicae]